MSITPRSSDFGLDRTPPKHDANWTLGISRPEPVDEPEARGRQLEYESRQTVVDEGDEAKLVYFVAEGAVMLSKLLPDGRRQIIELLGPGDVFGFTTTRLYDVSAETLGPSRLIAYDRAAVGNSLSLQSMITERMKAQICALHDHTVLLGRKSAVERVATFLMRLVPARGGNGCVGPSRALDGGKGDVTNVTVPLTRQEIADYLGLTLETVSRAFSHLKKTGLLAYGRHDAVTIADVCRLCRTTGSH